MNTPLSSFQLDAFAAVVKFGSFSKAAKNLLISQPALSTRVASLENDLQVALIRRAANGAHLTDAGKRLYSYVIQKEALEMEALAEISNRDSEFSGTLRLAGLSSLIPDLAIPVLAEMVRANSGVTIDFIVAPSAELSIMVSKREVDFVLLDSKVEDNSIESISLGREKYIAIESSKYSSNSDVFLDTDKNDPITKAFFAAQVRPEPVYRRMFLYNNPGILSGVIHGLGRAVLEARLITPGSAVRKIKKYRPLYRDVWLCFAKSNYKPKFQNAVIDALISGSHKILEGAEFEI